MFGRPKELAHLSFILVILGFIIQSIAIKISETSGIMVGIAVALYFSAFPFAVAGIIANFRVEREGRFGLFGAIEVGLGVLPFLLTLIMIIYIYARFS